MSIKLRCRCGGRLKVSNDQAGLKARCPYCGRILDVPTWEELEAERERRWAFVKKVFKRKEKKEEPEAEVLELAEEAEEAPGELEVAPEAPPSITPLARAPAAQLGVSLPRSHYAPIRIIARIYEILGWIGVLVAILALGGSIAFYVMTRDTKYLIYLPGIIALGALWLLLFKFFSEMTKVLADVGDNSREMLEELRRLREISEPQKKEDAAEEDE